MADETEIPDELIVTFRKPIMLGELTYTEMKLHEPTAGQLMQWDKLEGAEADVMAVTVVSGLPKIVIEKLPVRELNKASRYIGRFLS